MRGGGSEVLRRHIPSLLRVLPFKRLSAWVCGIEALA